MLRSSTSRGWAIALVAPLCLVAFVVFADAITGAIWTSLMNGDTVNANLYDAKEDVWLNGGPAGGGPGPDPGIYIFQVTDPSGKVLLSQDKAECRQVEIADVAGQGRITGVIGPCPHATSPDVNNPGAITVQLIPYANTPNNGGEYKVWLTSLTDFLAACGPGGLTLNPNGNGPNSLSTCDGSFGFVGGHIKTDNYKVKAQAPLGSIACEKYYDANDNGVRDGELGIAGWPIKICHISNGGGNQGSIPVGDCACTLTSAMGFCPFANLGDGVYRLQEALALDINPIDWRQTEPTSPATSSVFADLEIINGAAFDPDLMNGIHEFSIINGSNEGPLRFGNIACELTPVDGGLTWGYWKTHTGTGETPSGAPIDPIYLDPLGIDLGLNGDTHLFVDSAANADTVFAADGSGAGDEPPWPSPDEISDLCSVLNDCRNEDWAHPADCNGDCHEQLAVQLLALKLNILSGDFALGDVYINVGDPNSGKTLGEIIDEADTALSDWFNGGAFDFGALQFTIDTINNNAHNGGVVFNETCLPAAPPVSFVSGCP